ncbi:hypothetical protein [Bacillus badius]|nr:hypothetical protein [Bacillus badius]KZR60033.1 hypothetical protein A3781_07465 [Bacillus badius]MED4714869.1 hypothetical protein [Bacillus badius]
MAEEFNESLLMRKKGKKFTEEDFTQFLESYGFINIKFTKPDDRLIRVHARQPVIVNNKTDNQPRTMWVRCNDDMIIQEIEWWEGFFYTKKELIKFAVQGCLILVAVIVLLVLII